MGRSAEQLHMSDCVRSVQRLILVLVEQSLELVDHSFNARACLNPNIAVSSSLQRPRESAATPVCTILSRRLDQPLHSKSQRVAFDGHPGEFACPCQKLANQGEKGTVSPGHFNILAQSLAQSEINVGCLVKRPKLCETLSPQRMRAGRALEDSAPLR